MSIPRRHQSLPCSVCGLPMWKGPGSLPIGMATCRKCRAARPGYKPKSPPRSGPKKCARCELEIPNRRKYCDPCKEAVRGDSWSRKTLTANDVERAREYRSARHKAERRRVLAEVSSGEAFCWRCGQHIPPGAPVHVGHDDWDRSVYRGAECPSCNLSAAARKARMVQQRKPRTFLERLAAKSSKTEKKCVGCGDLFTEIWPDQRFCTRACLLAHPEARKNGKSSKPKYTQTEIPLRTCAECGSLHSHPRSLYCGRICYDVHARRRGAPRACGDCGIDIPSTRKKCDRCRAANKRAQKRRYRSRLRARRKESYVA